jgi:hypothetical protein
MLNRKESYIPCEAMKLAVGMERSAKGNIWQGVALLCRLCHGLASWCWSFKFRTLKELIPVGLTSS